MPSRRTLPHWFAIVALLLLPGGQPARAAPTPPETIVVKFRPGTDTARELTGAAGAAEAQPAPGLAKLGVRVLRLPAGQSAATLAALRQNPAVEFAEADGMVHIADTPPALINYTPSPLASLPNGKGGIIQILESSCLLRSLENADCALGQIIPDDPNWNLQYGPARIRAPQAWEITTGTVAVTVAVIDTGVALSHTDLLDKIWLNPGETGLDAAGNDRRSNEIDDDHDGYIDDWRGWDFVNRDNTPDDDHGHGSHVAGIVAASTNNGVGIAGVAWNARLMPLKILASNGYGADSDLAEAMIYATDHGAQIINLSLGDTAPAQVIETALNYAAAHNVLVVAAAGNAGKQGVLYPAAYPAAVAVAATDANNQRAGFSNYGAEVALAAPGASIYSTLPGNGYGYKSGTSMATPHVAGVAALLAGLPQFDTAAKIRRALEATALDLGTPGWDMYYGYGLVQADAALRYVPPAVTHTLYIPYFAWNPYRVFLPLVERGAGP